MSNSFALVVEFAVAPLGRADLDRFDGEDRPVGLSDRELAIGGEFEPPPQLVDEMMVPSA